MVDFKGKPAYLQIADELRQQIIDGRLGPDAKVPSESQLMASYDVSRTVAKMAIGVLRSEGLIYSHPGKGSFVRIGEPLRRRTGNRYKRQAQPPFASDAKAAGKQADWEYQTTYEKASSEIAERLKIAPGDDVVVTSYRFLADGQPIQVSTSYEPLGITGGTPIERPEDGPTKGVIARMDSIGRYATHVDEVVTARPATTHESEQLDIPERVQVFCILRTHYEHDTPLEVCDIVVPSDRYELFYRIPIEDADKPS